MIMLLFMVVVVAAVEAAAEFSRFVSKVCVKLNKTHATKAGLCQDNLGNL